MTVDTLNELRAELERLRRDSRSDIAQRLREARTYGDGSNNDEYHAVREEQMVLEARLRSLEATIARAKVVDRREIEDGVAVLGSTLLIEDLESRALSEYRLGSAHETLRAGHHFGQLPDGQGARRRDRRNDRHRRPSKRPLTECAARGGGDSRHGGNPGTSRCVTAA